ncbi:Polysaccharide biosynthesis protein [Microbacterium sp. C448]|uniref:DegT/DnrJ/EryC1/StrS family aminotransferase n=1 Tax=Microbacterium sp. C448 TaxID=1177594 RepID=UPI0003DE29A6|nr:DegT/DnrJ/EryC1/StrS family aminotransferase [Microbacterium sp. C448]CDK01552.1 Polysaccharide biosynthesis protein [Microbacterium sp. C448]
MTTPNQPTFPLATSSWDDAEHEAMQRVIASGRFTMGPLVAQFERDFAAEFGAGHAVMVNSGSSANLLAIAAAVLDPEIDLNPGDEVLVPAVSWATTYYPLQQYGLKLRFVDIDLDTLNMDLDLAEQIITDRTKAVFAVNILGNPNDYARLQRICDERGLLLLEDNCESLGATFDGRAAGTFGVMGTFSTFYSHHIATMEGGVVLTDDERLHQILMSLRAHGWTRELPAQNFVHDKSGDPFEDSFCFALPGYNFRPVEMSGALGIEQVKKIPMIIRERRRNGAYFTQAMSSVPDVRIQKEVGESSWFGFSMILEGPYAGRRREVGEALSAAGIESRPIVAGNFTRNPVMSYLDAIVPEALPAADAVHYDGLFVGNRHYPTESSIDQLREILIALR